MKRAVLVRALAAAPGTTIMVRPHHRAWHPVRGYPQRRKTAEPARYVRDTADAYQRLITSEKLTLASRQMVGTILDTLRDEAKAAAAAGQQARTINLCDAAVAGTNMFCEETLGYLRAEMPQLAGPPTPGSPSALLPPDGRGEVDIGPSFIGMLTGQGVLASAGVISPEHLKSTQRELDGVKVAGIMGAYASGVLRMSPLFVSRDNYIIDGHHRWAALVGLSLKGRAIKVPIIRLDADILELLPLAHQHAADMGLTSATMTSGRHWTKSDEAAAAPGAKAAVMIRPHVRASRPVRGSVQSRRVVPKPVPRARKRLGIDVAREGSRWSADKNIQAREIAQALMKEPTVKALLAVEVTPTEEQLAGVEWWRHWHPKQCFEMAGRYMTDTPIRAAVMVHGTYQPMGFRCGHAWIELPGEIVFDGNMQRFFPMAEYVKQYKIIAEHRYTKEQAVVQMLKSHVWGPWAPLRTSMMGDEQAGVRLARRKTATTFREKASPS